jgi:hypothetical protein
MICFAAALLCDPPPPDSATVQAASRKWYACAGDASVELESSARNIDELVAAALVRCAAREAEVRAALTREWPAEVVTWRVTQSRREIRDLIGEGHALRVRTARGSPK